MRGLSVIGLLTTLILPTVALAEVQTITATHTYVLGDHDSKDDARQRCLLETKRKILEQAGVYIESASEVKDLQLTKDKITSFAAAVMQVKDTKEEVGFQQGHMTLKLTTTAQVDLAEVRKQLAARQVDASVRDTVAAQQERLKRLEAQFDAMQKYQQVGQTPGRTRVPPTYEISTEVQLWRARAAKGDPVAQTALGVMYLIGVGHDVPVDYAQSAKWYEKAAAQGHASAQDWLGRQYFLGRGVPQDVAQAAMWYEKAAAQGHTSAQDDLGVLYLHGLGVPQDYAKARQWFEKAAAQELAEAHIHLGSLYANGWGVPKDDAQAAKWYEKAAVQGNAEAQIELGKRYLYGRGVPQDDVRSYMWLNLVAGHGPGDYQQHEAAIILDKVAIRMTSTQIAEAQSLMSQCQARQFKGC